MPPRLSIWTSGDNTAKRTTESEQFLTNTDCPDLLLASSDAGLRYLKLCYLLDLEAPLPFDLG